MCRAVRCRHCEKKTWSGCGAHVAQVKARVPADQWCEGHEDQARLRSDGFLARFLGRGDGR